MMATLRLSIKDVNRTLRFGIGYEPRLDWIAKAVPPKSIMPWRETFQMEALGASI